VKGCGRPANIIFEEGETIEMCNCCGTKTTKRMGHRLCYEHAYVYMKEKHDNLMANKGYIKQGADRGLRWEKLPKEEEKELNDLIKKGSGEFEKKS
jgi:hypothetical protein